MKAHIGEDTSSGLVHTVVPTAANVIEPLSGSPGRTHGQAPFSFEDTLMSIFQGLLFLLLGAGLLRVDYQALRSGSLPCGPNGFKGRLAFSRREQPVGFWVMFILYGAGGLWLLALALRLLVGQAAPLPLR